MIPGLGDELAALGVESYYMLTFNMSDDEYYEGVFVNATDSFFAEAEASGEPVVI